ncbi:MAG: FkbM family methyltransferase [Thermoplasmatales archaeon]
MYSVSALGLKVYYNHPHDVAALIETFVLNVYRSELINKGDTVLDLGAGIGEFSLLASRKIGPNGKVIAIEPSPDDYETLLRNIKENKCDNVTPINIAVADFEGELELEFKGKTFKAVSRPLRDILNDENIDKINFCKMDIEGGEREVIPSNISIISGIHYLSMEIHGGYQNELIPIMERLGFRFERITKKSYIQNVMRFTLRHPFKAYTLLHLLKRAGEYPGITKIRKGIDIERSDKLVVGTFINRITQE